MPAPGKGGLYVIGLGSNVRHPRHGAPSKVLHAAFAALDEGDGLAVLGVSPVIATAPLGHARRRYANAAAILACDHMPDALLLRLKAIERRFGRRRRGKPWSARVLDLDILLWNGGAWAEPDLIVPHPAFRERRFALGPAAALAPAWRDPISGLTLRHLHTRLTRRRPLPIGGRWSGP